MTHKWKHNVVLPALASSFLGRVQALLEKLNLWSILIHVDHFAFVLLPLLLAFQALLVIFDQSSP